MELNAISATSPIFAKSYDFLLWLLNHTEKFPKNERFRLARRLEDAGFEFYELLIHATRSPKRRQALLLEADLGDFGLCEDDRRDYVLIKGGWFAG